LPGFNADRVNGSDGSKCRRIDSGFAYPRWTNSIAQQEQIEIGLRRLQNIRSIGGSGWCDR